jgi:DNA replication factor GINS
MDLEFLADRLAIEQNSNSLQVLDEKFYLQASDFIQDLQDARGHVKDYRELAALDDEIKNARILIEGVYDKRMSKITQYAAIAAAGTKISIDGMTRAERTVYEQLLTSLQKGRGEILMPALTVTQVTL